MLLSRLDKIWRLLGTALLLLAVGACSASSLRDYVPEKLASQAEIPGMGKVRVWGDQAGGAMRDFLAEEVPRAKERMVALSRSGDGATPKTHILALSGGADDGAFGAGLLVGWTAHGGRPNFTVVTGVSAGALIAPFAFLGKEHDRQLEAIFKLYSGEDIFTPAILPGLLGGSALADTTPLANLIARYVDAHIVAALAQERARGRLLLIGTTNLDAQRPVFWDIGRIAQSRHPGAIDLIRKVLLASASIPGLFPPVRIRVTVNGQVYEELHVDGGPTREVFFAPNDFSFRAFDRAVGHKIERSLWVIRNGRLEPEYSNVESSALAISQRSIETLVKYQSIGDLIRIYHNARSEDVDFNLASIPHSFTAPRPQPFDRGYMRTLFEFGYKLGRANIHWAKAPPGVLVAGQ